MSGLTGRQGGIVSEVEEPVGIARRKGRDVVQRFEVEAPVCAHKSRHRDGGESANCRRTRRRVLYNLRAQVRAAYHAQVGFVVLA